MRAAVNPVIFGGVRRKIERGEGHKINFQLATRNFLGLLGRDSSRRRRVAAFDITRTCGRFTRLYAKIVSERGNLSSSSSRCRRRGDVRYLDQSRSLTRDDKPEYRPRVCLPCPTSAKVMSLCRNFEIQSFR